jgi:hypothetical protein
LIIIKDQLINLSSLFGTDPAKAFLFLSNLTIFFTFDWLTNTRQKIPKKALVDNNII